MKKKEDEISFFTRMRIISKAGIKSIKAPNLSLNNTKETDDLPKRIANLLALFNVAQKNRDMIYFIMYDIENDKIRREIAKYLEAKACIRVQKSIFVHHSNRKIYKEICTTLIEVNEVYENNDSILVVPVSDDNMQAMRIIGQQIDFDMINNNKTTMFF